MSGCWGDVPGQAVSHFLGLGNFPQPYFLKSAGVAPSVRVVSFTDVKPDGISNHWSPWLFLMFLSSQRANPESHMTCCFTVRHMLYEGKWTYKSFYIQGVLSCSGIWRSKHNNECPHISPSLFLLRFAGQEQSQVRSLQGPAWCFCALTVHGVAFFSAVNFHLPQLVQQLGMLVPVKAHFSFLLKPPLCVSPDPGSLTFVFGKRFPQHIVSFFYSFFWPLVSCEKWKKSGWEEVE